MVKEQKVILLQSGEVTECQIEVHQAGQLRLRAELS